MTDTLGARIRMAREQVGWTQQELADAVKVSRETVGNWELGTTSPRNSLARLRDVLGEDVIDGIVSTRPDDDSVLASLPPGSVEGFDAADLAEVVAAAKLGALQRAREIKRLRSE